MVMVARLGWGKTRALTSDNRRRRLVLEAWFGGRRFGWWFGDGGGSTMISFVSMIDFGALPPLVKLLSNPRTDTIRREACSVIMKIAAGTKELLEAVIQAGIVGPLVNLLEQAEIDARKEAAWAMSKSESHAHFIIMQICSLLGCEDPFAVYSCLVALENILRAGEEEKKGINVYAQMVSQAGGAEKVWNLQGNDQDDIDEAAVEILELYFEELMGAQQQDGSNEVLVEVEEGLAEAHRGPEFELISCFWCLECATSSLVLELKCRYLSAYVHI
ncbi:Importin subunit alpha-like protein, partial [Drosera capensis]